MSDSKNVQMRLSFYQFLGDKTRSKRDVDRWFERYATPAMRNNRENFGLIHKLCQRIRTQEKRAAAARFVQSYGTASVRTDDDGALVVTFQRTPEDDDKRN